MVLFNMEKSRPNIWPIILLLTIFGGSCILIFRLYFQKAVFTGKDQSIAVLPFVHQPTDSTSEYFEDGMTDEIISRLSRMPGFKVIARGSVMGYKGKDIDVERTAKELNVSSILEGMVTNKGNRLHIHVNLFDAGTGKSLWEEDYDRDLNDVFSVQNELASLIAENLDSKWQRTDKESLSLRPTQNLEAYDQYLQGRYFWNKGNEASLRKAILFFEQAIRLDPEYAKAYSGLADCYSALGYGSYELPAKAFLKAESAALKAILLDSSLADPHASLGYIKFYYYWDWAGAETEFLKSIQLNPSYVLAYDAYCYYLTAMERFPEAKMAIEKAVQLDPLSAKINTDRGFQLYYNKDYDEAMAALKNARLLNPKYPLTHIWMARCYLVKKMYREAIEENKQALSVNRNWPVAFAAIGNVYGASGQNEESKEILDTMLSLTSSIYVTPYGLALVYAGRHDLDNTFKNLDLAMIDRSNWLVWLKLDPRWQTVSQDPRYHEMLKKIGLDRIRELRQGD
jgi:adenylate cyclase